MSMIKASDVDPGMRVRLAEHDTFRTVTSVEVDVPDGTTKIRFAELDRTYQVRSDSLVEVSGNFPSEKTPGPEWYAMADGRQFFEYEPDELAQKLAFFHLSSWNMHCVWSAAEHYFRMGAKPGELESDWAGFEWWMDQTKLSDDVRQVLVSHLTNILDDERRKLGR